MYIIYYFILKTKENSIQLNQNEININRINIVNLFISENMNNILLKMEMIAIMGYFSDQLETFCVFFDRRFTIKKKWFSWSFSHSLFRFLTEKTNRFASPSARTASLASCPAPGSAAGAAIRQNASLGTRTGLLTRAVPTGVIPSTWFATWKAPNRFQTPGKSSFMFLLRLWRFRRRFSGFAFTRFASQFQKNLDMSRHFKIKGTKCNNHYRIEACCCE